MDAVNQQSHEEAVRDVQRRLAALGHLQEDQVSGAFDGTTRTAIAAFCAEAGLPAAEEVDDKTWAALLDATFQLGDRTLYLRMPYFHGNDVLQLQRALGALGFACADDGIFGAHAESALRRFQMNMGLPSDGIAGAYTYRSLASLQHNWEGKPAPRLSVHVGFARAADVLEQHALCLFGTDAFTRSCAARMSNLALATNPASKIVSAESLLVPPDEHMLLVHLVLDEADAAENVPFVTYEAEDTLALRLRSALGAVAPVRPRLAVCLPGTVWMEAGEGRSAQHFAITLLDAFCSALADEEGE